MTWSDQTKNEFAPSFEIARKITRTSYGLVFGFNTFLALGFQTILTSVVADSVGLALPPRDQFRVYAGFFLVVGIVFLVSASVSCARGGLERIKTEGLWISAKDQNGTSQPDPLIENAEHE